MMTVITTKKTTMSTEVISKVAALPSLKHDELKKLWRELFDELAPRKKRDYLIPRLAWRIQERPTVGTKLIREYQGVEHQVTVTRIGFEYQGRTFRSLSHIARVTEVNGQGQQDGAHEMSLEYRDGL
jgi:hypothetical protein